MIRLHFHLNKQYRFDDTVTLLGGYLLLIGQNIEGSGVSGGIGYTWGGGKVSKEG